MRISLKSTGLWLVSVIKLRYTDRLSTRINESEGGTLPFLVNFWKQVSRKVACYVQVGLSPRGAPLLWAVRGCAPSLGIFFYEKLSNWSMYLEGKFPEWGVTFSEIPLDDLSINKLMSCANLNQIEQHFCGAIIHTTEYFDDFLL